MFRRSDDRREDPRNRFSPPCKRTPKFATCNTFLNFLRRARKSECVYGESGHPSSSPTKSNPTTCFRAGIGRRSLEAFEGINESTSYAKCDKTLLKKCSYIFRRICCRNSMLSLQTLMSAKRGISAQTTIRRSTLENLLASFQTS